MGQALPEGEALGEPDELIPGVALRSPVGPVGSATHIIQDLRKHGSSSPGVGHRAPLCEMGRVDFCACTSGFLLLSVVRALHTAGQMWMQRRTRPWLGEGL